MARRFPVRSAGLTLVEVLFSAFVASLALAAILQGYVVNVHLTDLASSKVAYQLAVDQYLETLRQQVVNNFAAFWTLAATPADQHLAGARAGEPSFTNPTGYTGELLVRYIQKPYGNGQAIEVTLDPMWREAGNRVIGEDTNLNGILDAGEDVNTNGWLDSPFQVTIRMAKRISP